MPASEAAADGAALQLAGAVSIAPPALAPPPIDDAPPSAYSPEAGFRELPATEIAENLSVGSIAALLDVRSAAEFATAHVAGARSVPLDALSQAVKDGALDGLRNQPIAVICGSGLRSAQATVRLTKVTKVQATLRHCNKLLPMSAGRIIF